MQFSNITLPLSPASIDVTAANFGKEMRVGNSASPSSDNNCLSVGQDYSDANPLSGSIHSFCVSADYSFTASGGQSGNDYDTAAIYSGDGIWGHHNHYQTGTVFSGNVEFDYVAGLAGTITVEDNAQIAQYRYIDFLEAVPSGTASVGQNICIRYTTSHYASDMTNITSATVNYALEVRRFLLDPTTEYAASVFSEGQATFKAISASDNETSPYNVDGTLNTSLERFNIRVGAGLNAYMKYQNSGNIWLVGQPADSINFRIRTTAGGNAGIDVNNIGIHSLNATALSAWGAGQFGLQIDKTAISSTGGADIYFSSNAYFDGANWKRMVSAGASQISAIGGDLVLKASGGGAADSNIDWATALSVNGDGKVSMPLRTIATASATGITGEICYDADYIYICTATNTWKRVAIATW